MASLRAYGNRNGALAGQGAGQQGKKTQGNLDPALSDRRARPLSDRKISRITGRRISVQSKEELPVYQNWPTKERAALGGSHPLCHEAVAITFHHENLR